MLRSLGGVSPADCKALLDGFRRATGRLHGRVHLDQCQARVVEKRAARNGQLHTTRAPAEQLAADLIFQIANLPAQGRLRVSSRMEAKDGSFGFDFAGTYTKIVPNQWIEYSFEGRAGVVEFLPAPKGVTLRVTFDAETTHPEEQQRQGWQAILHNFAKHVAAEDKAS